MFALWFYHRHGMVWLLQGGLSFASSLSFHRSFHYLYRDFYHIILIVLFTPHLLSFLQDLIPFLFKPPFYQLNQLFVPHLKLLNPPQKLDVLRLVLVEVLLVPLPLSYYAFP